MKDKNCNTIQKTLKKALKKCLKCKFKNISAYNDVSNRNQHEKKNHGQLFTLALKATTEVGE